MTIEEKIKLYLSKKGKVLGCELPNKVFHHRFRRIKINPCADRIARRMFTEKKLLKDYVQLKGEGQHLAIYSLEV